LHQVVLEPGWFFSATISDPHHHHVFPIFREWRRTSKVGKATVRIPRVERGTEQTDGRNQEKNWKLFSTTHLSDKPIFAHNGRESNAGSVGMNFMPHIINGKATKDVTMLPYFSGDISSPDGRVVKEGVAGILVAAIHCSLASTTGFYLATSLSRN